MIIVMSVLVGIIYMNTKLSIIVLAMSLVAIVTGLKVWKRKNENHNSISTVNNSYNGLWTYGTRAGVGSLA